MNIFNLDKDPIYLKSIKQIVVFKLTGIITLAKNIQ